MSASNTLGTGASSPAAAPRQLYINGGNYGYCMWNATARSLATGGAGANLVIDKADRSATSCYMRGLREVIRVQSSSGLPWQWRRIVFSTKDDLFSASVGGDTAPVQPYRSFSDDSNNNIGMERLWFNSAINNTPNTIAVFNGVIFQGAEGKDWTNLLNAKTDSTRITVKSDRTTNIYTGNASGFFKTFKLWYPMNKNLVYDDDETGAAENSSYTSTRAKPGMGDLYVLDIIIPGIGSTTSDLINFDSQATLYWHER